MRSRAEVDGGPAGRHSAEEFHRADGPARGLSGLDRDILNWAAVLRIPSAAAATLL